MSESPNYWRQLDVFDPDTFKEEVHIIGVGALGSWVAYVLAKIGVRKIHAWDHDEVADYNCPNSIYGRYDIGRLKVEALAERLDRDCECMIVPHPQKVDGTQRLSGIVFLCTDSMTSRQEIWRKALKLKPRIKLVVEARMGAELGMVHTVRPINRDDIVGFEGTLYDSDEAEESPCTYRGIASTISMISGIAAHKLVKFSTGQEYKPVITLQETSPAGDPDDLHAGAEMFCIRPILATAASWT